MKLGVGGNVGLDEHYAAFRIEPSGQPVEENLDGVFFDVRSVSVVGGEGVPVGDEEEAVVLILHADPVLERADVVAEMKLAGRAHAAQDALFGGGSSHSEFAQQCEIEANKRADQAA